MGEWSKDKKEEKRDTSVTMEEINKLRSAMSEHPQKRIDGVLWPSFEQVMVQWGYAKFDRAQGLVVTQPDFYAVWARVNKKIEAYDTAKYWEAIEQSPEEKAAHIEKVKHFSEEMQKLAVIKTYETVDNSSDGSKTTV